MTPPDLNLAADFLSHYTVQKLQNGGEPVITADELNNAAASFWQQTHHGQRPVGEQLTFADLAAVAQTWHDRALRLDPDAAAGFTVDGDRLLPTYAFHHHSGKSAKVLTTFFQHAALPVLTPETPLRQPVTRNTRRLAAVAADYLTDYFAQTYIANECRVGHWPCHLTSLNNLYDHDLARHLQLAGDKKYFHKFRTAATDYLAQLATAAPDGIVRLTNQVGGTLAYNNLRRLTLRYPLIDAMCQPTTTPATSEQFRLRLRTDRVNVTERAIRQGQPQTARRRDLTPAALLSERHKLRRLHLGERLHVLRRAVSLLTDDREK